jgi:hypothetical protein
MTAVMVPCLCTMSLAPLTCLTYTLILKSRLQCGRADAVGHAQKITVRRESARRPSATNDGQRKQTQKWQARALIGGILAGRVRRPAYPLEVFAGV